MATDRACERHKIMGVAGRHGECEASGLRSEGRVVPDRCPRVASTASGPIAASWASTVMSRPPSSRATTQDRARSTACRATPPHPVAPVNRCHDGEQPRRSLPKPPPRQNRLDVIQTAVWFVATQAGGPARILAAHRRLPDGICAGCVTTPTRWPCTAAAIAVTAQHGSDSPHGQP